MYERALAIREQALGPDHPHTQTVRRNLAALEAPGSSNGSSGSGVG
ncbi:MAG: tetratricopeptide repeat protein [Chloroflexales bacterium]|nr:tetratricopeptide repeat protein [Chloroflexales bacterium]